jgi:hypothetical protein
MVSRADKRYGKSPKDDDEEDEEGEFSANTKNLTPAGRKSLGLSEQPPKVQVFRPGISRDSITGEGEVSGKGRK